MPGFHQERDKFRGLGGRTEPLASARPLEEQFDKARTEIRPDAGNMPGGLTGTFTQKRIGGYPESTGVEPLGRRRTDHQRTDQFRLTTR